MYRKNRWSFYQFVEHLKCSPLISEEFVKIAKHAVVGMEYTLTDGQGNVLDTSAGREPLVYVQGVGAIIPGLEKQMEGKSVGDKFKVEIAPQDAYGERNESMMQEIPREHFGEQEVEVGQQFQVMTAHGAHIITVIDVLADKVMVDGNHPMAGKTLFFDIEVKEVRAASEDELASFSNQGGCGGGCSGCGSHGDDDEEEGGCCGGGCH